MNTRAIESFSFVVEDVFAFASGATVFVGRLAPESAPKLLVPCDAEIVVDGRAMGTIRLSAERMSGPRHPGIRAVETVDQVEVSSIRGRHCLLVHRE